MADPAVADADPVARALTYLRGYEPLTEVLGPGGRVSGVNRPPYPNLVVSDPPGGDLRAGLWLTSTAVMLEAFGDPDGRHGRELLRRIILTALGGLAVLPDAPRSPTDVVVTAVEFSGGAGWAPTATGQPRYLATCSVTSHPPN